MLYDILRIGKKGHAKAMNGRALFAVASAATLCVWAGAAFGMTFVTFVENHSNEWEAVMSYRYGERHVFTEEYDARIRELFGLMREATDQFYSETERAEHSADMAVLWASLTGILSVAVSERQVGGLTLEQMLDRLIQMYLSGRTGIRFDQ